MLEIQWMPKSLQPPVKYPFQKIVAVLSSFKKEKIIAFLQFSECVYPPANIIFSICRRWIPVQFSKDIAYSKSFASAVLGWDDICLHGCVPMSSIPYISQSLCSPVPLFRSTDVPGPLYSSVPLFPNHFLSRLSPVSILPSPFAPQSLCSQTAFFPNPNTPQKWFPVPMFPKYISQSLLSGPSVP